MSAGQMFSATKPPVVDSWETLFDFVDNLWIPSDGVEWNGTLDDEIIKKICADLMTVEDIGDSSPDEQKDDSGSSERHFLRNRPVSNDPRDHHYSSGSITPSSSDDAVNQPFSLQEWYVQDEVMNKVRPPKLLEFLHLLLNNPRYSSYASWLDRDKRRFRIHKPDGVSSLWQKVKVRRTNGSMNYDTFARGIRYYYKSGLMLKTHTKHTYCFART